MKKKLYYTRDTYYCRVNDIKGFSPYDISSPDEKYLISGKGKTPDQIYYKAREEVLNDVYPYKYFLHAYFEKLKSISYLIPNFYAIQMELYRRSTHLNYINNIERVKAYQKEYNATHKEKIKARTKRYAETHKEELKAKSKIYREKNKEKIRQRGIEFRRTHKELVRARKHEYYSEHKTEKFNYDLKRRRDKVMSWVDKFGGKCQYCGKTVVYGVYHNRPEFHHSIPEGKHYDLMYMFSRPGMFTDADIMKEIKDGGVVLLCHDCHNLETQKQNRMLSPDQIEELKQMRKSGKTIKYIKEYFGFKSSTSVYSYLNR